MAFRKVIKFKDSIRALADSNTIGSIFTTGGNIGIGTTAPSSKLDVVGDINLTGTLYQNSAPFSTSQWTGSIGSAISYTSGTVIASNVSVANVTITNALATNETITGGLLITGGSLKATASANTIGPIITTLTDATFSNLVPITNGLFAYYNGSSWTGTQWNDLTTNGNHATTIGGTINTTTENSITYLYGDTSARIRFPTSVLPSTYTFFHVAKYNGSTRRRIFDGVTNNWLSGFWDLSAIGNSGIAYHNQGWLGPSSGVTGSNNFLLSSDQKGLYRANGNVVGTGSGDSTHLSIMDGVYASESSDWAVSEIIVYNRELTTDEIEQTESWLMDKYSAFTFTTSLTYSTTHTAGTVSVGTYGSSGLFVGISNTSPSYLLDVNGDINLTGDLYQNGALFGGSQWTGSAGSVLSYTSNSVIMTNASVSNITATNILINKDDASLTVKSKSENQISTLYLGTPHENGVAYKSAIIAEGFSGWSRSRLHFCLNNDTSNDASFSADIGDSRMTILPDGNVGIGTVSPNSNLTIYSPSSTTFNIQSSSANTKIYSHSDTRTYFQSLGDIFFTGIDSDQLRHLCLRTNGNVGIGTTAPSFNLDVNGTIGAIAVTTGALAATNISVTNLVATNETVVNLTVTNETIQNLIVVDDILVTDLSSSNATITNSLITNLSATNLAFTTVSAGSATATIGTVVTTNVVATNETVSSLFATGASATNLAFTTVSAGSATATIGTVVTTDLIATNLSTGTIRNINEIAVGQDLNSFTIPTPLAPLDIVAKPSKNSAVAAFQYPYSGGFRHWVTARHNTGSNNGNAIDFYLNTGNNPGDSSTPGTNNQQVMTIAGLGVGIGTTDPNVEFTVRQPNITVNDPSSTGLVEFRGSQTSTQGESVLRLGRGHHSGNFWGSSAEFNIRRGYLSGTDAASAMDILLGAGQSDNPNTTVMTLVANGNVGIGTTSPSYKLEVNGGLYSTNITTTKLVINTGNITNESLLLTNVSNSGVISFGDEHHSIRSGHIDKMELREYGSIGFWTGGFLQNQTLRMFLPATGNVGISTTSPNFTLDVNGTIGANSITTGALVATNISVTNLLATNETVVNLITTFETVTNLLIADDIRVTDLTSSNSNLTSVTAGGIVVTAGGLRATFNSNTIGNIFTTGGNVGVGTIAPSAAIHISNTSGNRVSGLRITTPQSGIVLDTTSTNGRNFNIWSSNSTDSVSAGCLAIYDETDGAYRMVINSAGNVGIGTIRPSARLDVVGGALRVTGGGLIATFNSNTIGAIITTGGSVGIGIPNPHETLDVLGGIGINTNNSTGVLRITSTGNANYIQSAQNNTNDSRRPLYFTSMFAATTYMTINTSGNVGIGTTSPSYRLHVSGDIYATGDVISFSDKRLKENIENISEPLSKIKNLQGVYYTNTQTKQKGVGLIAQEVEKIIPEAVADRGEYLGVAYGNLVGVLIEAVKELSEKVNTLEIRLSNL